MDQEWKHAIYLHGKQCHVNSSNCIILYLLLPLSGAESGGGAPQATVGMALHSTIAESVTEMGLNALKDKQLEAVQGFVRGRDGKSVIFAILPLVFDKIRGTSAYSVLMI